MPASRRVAHVFSTVATVACSYTVLLLASSAAAQSSDTSDWDSRGNAPATLCYPQCRSGYQCLQGECRPVCNPACEPGFLCSPGGQCVHMQPSAPAHAPAPLWSAPTNQCVPACRASYVCLSGQCVSACNPLCAAGETCTEAGQCVPSSTVPPAASADRPEPALKESESASKDSVFSLHADVAGLLQFGITPTVEVGKRISGYFQIRPLNTGLLSYVLIPQQKDEVLKWGVGGALGLHVFSATEGNMRGLYGGPAVEYDFVKTAQPKRDNTYGTHVLVPQLDLGYRWGLGSFLLGVGGRIGLEVPLAAFNHGATSSRCSGVDDCARPFNFLAGLVCDVGFYL
jgi:hypothetical protein